LTTRGFIGVNLRSSAAMPIFSHLLTNCVVAGAGGTSLTPYYNTALTIGGKVNKLAQRSDGPRHCGNPLVAATPKTYRLQIARVDGTPVQISPPATGP